MLEDIQAKARRTLEEIFPRADVAALADVIHPECFNHEAPAGAPQGVEGMQQLVLWLNRAFADLHYEIHKVVAQDDTVAVYCTMTGRHTGEFMGLPATHRQVASNQVHLVRFQDGKGIEHWAVRDDLTLMRQLGALPTHRSGTAGAASGLDASVANAIEQARRSMLEQ
jgi:predicted ester cyclase